MYNRVLQDSEVWNRNAHAQKSAILIGLGSIYYIMSY